MSRAHDVRVLEVSGDRGRRARGDAISSPGAGGPSGTRTLPRTTRDEALREAGAALTRAWQALHRVEAYGLASDTFALANRVLHARQQLQQGVAPVKVR